MALRGPTSTRPGYDGGATSKPAKAVAPAPVVGKKKTTSTKKKFTK